MPAEPRFMTVDQVAEILQVTGKSVRDFIAAGELRASKIGQWRITADDLRDFIDRRSNRAVTTFLDDSRAQPKGTLVACTIIDYYTDDPKPLMKRILDAVNAQPAEGFPNFSYTYAPETGRARYTVWGKPEFLTQLLGLVGQPAGEAHAKR